MDAAIASLSGLLCVFYAPAVLCCHSDHYSKTQHRYVLHADRVVIETGSSGCSADGPIVVMFSDLPRFSQQVRKVC
jgi:hypothetical protein